MRAIVVDDEPKAIELIRGYLDHFTKIELVATFRNGLKAFEFIASNPVDLIFLDINMPHLSGMSLSKMLPDTIRVVFTTAYSEYAVESYDVKATDYLLKPISLERFGRCITRLLDMEGTTDQQVEQGIIHIKDGAEIYRVNKTDCLYLKKEGNYMRYFTLERNIMTRQTIGEALDLLGSNFTQVHKSFIVNLAKVESFNSSALRIGNREIPIGESYALNFRKLVSIH